MYRWLLAEFNNKKHPGVVPSLERVQRKFREFEYCPSSDPVDILVGDMHTSNMKAQLLRIVENMDALLAEDEDPRAILGSILPAMRDVALVTGDNKHTLLSNSADALREEYMSMEVSDGITGIPYPWAPLNEATGGMHGGEFIVVYGRPKNMKTWIAVAIAVYAYLCGYRVLCFSKEMSVKKMLLRAASCYCKVDYDLLKRGRLPAEDKDMFFDILDMLATIEDTSAANGRKPAMSFLDEHTCGVKGGVTVDVLIAEAERFKADLLIVDGFYLMKDGRTGVRSRDWKNISNVSSDLKSGAQQLNIPVIGTTQANRGAAASSGDDTAEAAYSDAIGQDTDLMMRVFHAMTADKVSKVLLTFPAVRDALLEPFVINAVPGTDFSVLQTAVNVEEFLKEKRQLDKEDPHHSQGAGPERRKRATARIK